VRGALLFFIFSSAVPAMQAAVLPSSSVSSQSYGSALIFYAEPQVSDSLWPLLFQTLRADLSTSADDLPSGVVLDKEPVMLRGADDLRGISFSSIVSVKLLGRCDMLLQPGHPAPAGPLGWVKQVSGKIQPFVFIDCARLGEVLRPSTARMDKADRNAAMAQAISHVLIHEWSHIQAQSAAHSKRGLTQAYLPADTLIATPPAISGESRLSASAR
jgi:hypothetical protein